MSPTDSKIRWSTRSLFILTAAIALTLGVYLNAGPLAGLGAVFVLLLIAAHVVGTMVGCRLRDEGDSLFDDPQSSSTLIPSPAAESNRQKSTPVISTVVPIVCGMLLGGTIGGGALIGAYPHRLNPINISLAILAAASIGGLALFGVVRLIGAVRLGMRRESEVDATGIR